MQSARHGILFVIDGLRPDALQQAYTPEIDRLIGQGAYTWKAQTVRPSITLTCHVSLFHAVSPARHGVLSNVWTPPPSPLPSLLQISHEAGLSTASFYSWEPLRDLSPPGSLDIAYYHRLRHIEKDGDMEIASVVSEHVVRECPSFTFVYLGATDEVGHSHGWMSEPYLSAISFADRAIGLVLEASRISGDLDDTVCVVTADHGGHDFDHCACKRQDLTIPWIISGPGIRHGYQIKSHVSIMDTAPTIAHLLGLPVPAEWDGQVVTEALAQ